MGILNKSNKKKGDKSSPLPPPPPPELSTKKQEYTEQTEDQTPSPISMPEAEIISNDVSSETVSDKKQINPPPLPNQATQSWDEKRTAQPNFGFDLSNVPGPEDPVEVEEHFEPVPEALPSLPNMEDELIPSFDVENIPTFTNISFQNQEKEELPILDIEDEDVYKNFVAIEEKKPLYVRTDNFSQLISTIDAIKEHIKESDKIKYSLENLKNSQDREHRSYRSSLEDIQRKLIYVDKSLFNSIKEVD